VTPQADKPETAASKQGLQWLKLPWVPPAEKPKPKALTKVALEDAERLLKYAAQKGIHIYPTIRDPILKARTASGNEWNEETAGNLLTAITDLAERVRPVTAESLKAIEKVNLRGWGVLVFILAILIIPFSVATFVASGLSSAIRTDIVTGNDLAVKLTVQLGPLPAATQPVASIVTGASPPAASSPSTASPPEVQSDINKTNQITELQQFASTIRAISACPAIEFPASSITEPSTGPFRHHPRNRG
jgi:hypothetical protein